MGREMVWWDGVVPNPTYLTSKRLFSVFAMIRTSFRAQLHVTDKKEISRLKMLAIVGLQNYVIHEQTSKALEKKRKGK